MLEAVLTGAALFVLVFLVLRGLELAYHRWRKTKDWSPHWGSWVFAVLAGIYGVLSSLGR